MSESEQSLLPLSKQINLKELEEFARDRLGLTQHELDTVKQRSHGSDLELETLLYWTRKNPGVDVSHIAKELRHFKTSKKYKHICIFTLKLVVFFIVCIMLCFGVYKLDLLGNVILYCQHNSDKSPTPGVSYCRKGMSEYLEHNDVGHNFSGDCTCQLASGKSYTGKFDGTGNIVTYDGGTYNGQLKKMMRHGYGVMKRSSGEKYDGQWQYDEMQGYGTFETDYAKYEGYWIYGQLHGKGSVRSFRSTKTDGSHDEDIVTFPDNCTIIYNDNKTMWMLHNETFSGDIYEGNLENYKLNGMGTIIYCTGYWNGSKCHGHIVKLEGQFTNHNLNGRGVEIICAGDAKVSKHEGQFVNNVKHGVGLMTYNGCIYRGQWQQGEMYGNVTYVCPGQWKYEGEVVNYRLHGRGTCTWNGSNDTYSGQWNNDMMHGKGTFIWGNGLKYEGEFVNNTKHGDGTVTYTDGCQFPVMSLHDRLPVVGNSTCNTWAKIYVPIGLPKIESNYIGDVIVRPTWKTYKRHGQGTLKYPDGSTYHGQFEFDLRHGKGTLTLKNGHTLYDGEWANDKIHGHGMYVLSNGWRYESRFINNQQHGKGIVTNTNGQQILAGIWKSDILYIVHVERDY